MRIYPAIDIKDGKAVRLLQGRADDKTVYGDDPAEMARRWAGEGAQYLHVVDLDGAFTGEGKNLIAVARICSAVKIPVQLGGGIRSMLDIEKRFDHGVARVILGTAAVSNPDFVAQAAAVYPGRIVAGIDAKDGNAAIKGWVEVSSISAVELAKKLRVMGIGTVVYTDISKDGMLSGPNFEATKQMHDESGMDVIASGGICSLADLERLSAMGVHGAITGKAIYDGRIDLKEAIQIAKR